MLVILFTLLSLAYVYRQDKYVGVASTVYIFIVLLIHMLFYMEVSFFGLEYFVSDELAYIDFESAHGLSDTAKQDRILWFYANKFSSFPFFADGLFNKIISLPFLPLLLLLVSSFCEKRFFSLFLFLFCPYLLFLMQTALRDIAILFLILLIIQFWCSVTRHGGKSILYISLLVFLLFLLRPFAVFIVIFSIYLYELFSQLKGRVIKEKIFIVLYNAILAVVLSALLYFIFQNKIDTYIRTLTYFSENGLWLDESKSAVQPGLNFQYFSYAIIRYFSTPLPTSLLDRFLNEDVTQFGYLDDIVRFFNQSFYFIMLAAIFIKVVFLKFKLSVNWNSRVWILFIVTAFNSFIYALYYAGGGHSRLKLLLFIFVFIVLTCLEKRNNDVS